MLSEAAVPRLFLLPPQNEEHRLQIRFGISWCICTSFPETQADVRSPFQNRQDCPDGSNPAFPLVGRVKIKRDLLAFQLESKAERHDIGTPAAVDQSQTADVTAVHDSDDLLKVRNFSVTSSHFAHLKPFYAFCPARYPVENAIWRLNPPV